MPRNTKKNHEPADAGIGTMYGNEVIALDAQKPASQTMGQQTKKSEAGLARELHTPRWSACLEDIDHDQDARVLNAMA